MPLSKPQLVLRAKKIKLIAMDVDGVLTDGGVLVYRSGEEVKVWNAKDRLCLALIRDNKLPYIFVWITGRSSESVAAGAEDLGIHHVLQKCQKKKDALEVILSSHRLKWDEAAFIGDDLIDLPAIRAAGFGACPSDAVSDVRRHAHYISPIAGGRGIVRDVLEFILKAQKKWDPLVAPFLR